MAIHEYKINGKNEWKNINSIVLSLVVIFLGGSIMFYLRVPDGRFIDILPYFLIGFLVMSLPSLIIHLTYYSLNHGLIMRFDDFNREISIEDKKKGIDVVFSLNDISNVFHYMTTPMAEKRMHWFPWDSYNYSKIYLKDGRSFIITSLMVYRLELPIGDKYEVMNKFFPYPG